jgi:hypothetical protein
MVRDMDENPYKAPIEDELLAAAPIPKAIPPQHRRPWGFAIGAYLGMSICGVIVVDVFQIQEDRQAHNYALGLALMIGGILGAVLGFRLDLLRRRTRDGR